VFDNFTSFINGYAFTLAQLICNRPAKNLQQLNSLLDSQHVFWKNFPVLKNMTFISYLYWSYRKFFGFIGPVVYTMYEYWNDANSMNSFLLMYECFMYGNAPIEMDKQQHQLLGQERDVGGAEEVLVTHHSDILPFEGVHDEALVTFRVHTVNTMGNARFFGTARASRHNVFFHDVEKRIGVRDYEVTEQGHLTGRVWIRHDGDNALSRPFSPVGTFSPEFERADMTEHEIEERKNWKVPEWDNMVSKCLKMHETTPELKKFALLGWDMTINAKGEPVVIELNTRPTTFLFFNVEEKHELVKVFYSHYTTNHASGRYNQMGDSGLPLPPLRRADALTNIVMFPFFILLSTLYLCYTILSAILLIPLSIFYALRYPVTNGKFIAVLAQSSILYFFQKFVYTIFAISIALIAISGAFVIDLLQIPMMIFRPPNQKSVSESGVFREPKASTSEIVEDRKMNLRWSNINMVITEDEKRKRILHNVHGHARAGRLTAVLGPKGAGKTSLLNVLAASVQTKNTELTGRVTVNGQVISNMDVFSEVVLPTVPMHDWNTVQETIDFHVSLKQHRVHNVLDNARRVIKDLKLENVLQHPVRDLSPNDRKLLGIALDMLHDPAILLIDEPTTGLGPLEAKSVIRSLQSVAKQGRTVLCSVHDPLSEMWKDFDDIILLSEGRLVFCGTREEALDHFALRGMEAPKGYNRAEYLIDTVTVDKRSERSEKLSRERLNTLIDDSEENESDYNRGIRPSAHHVSSYHSPGFWTEFRYFLDISVKRLVRDRNFLFAVLIGPIIGGCILGYFFRNQGYDFGAELVREGIIFVQVMAMTLIPGASAGFIMPHVLKVVHHEQRNHLYTSIVFISVMFFLMIPLVMCPIAIFAYITNIITDLHPGFQYVGKNMLTCVLLATGTVWWGTIAAAIFMVPESAGPFAAATQLFGLFLADIFIEGAKLPHAIRWFKNFSIGRYANQALLVNEFRGVTMMRTGDQILEQDYGYQDVDLWFSIAMVGGYAALFMIVAAILLEYSHRRTYFTHLEMYSGANKKSPSSKKARRRKKRGLLAAEQELSVSAKAYGSVENNEN